MRKKIIDFMKNIMMTKFFVMNIVPVFMGLISLLTKTTKINGEEVSLWGLFLIGYIIIGMWIDQIIFMFSALLDDISIWRNKND